MFYLHSSNRTEYLVLQLAALLKAAPPPVFEREYFLVQSQGMERWLCQAIARELSSWCNYLFYFPLSFLDDITERLRLDFDTTPNERSRLVWKIEEMFRSLQQNGAADCFRPVLQALDTGSPVARFRLSRQLANLFDEYQLMRPQMLAAWEQGRQVTSLRDELWQMELWRTLVRKAAREVPGSCHRGQIFDAVRKYLLSTESVPTLPARISIFGVHVLPPVFLDCLEALSRHCDVHLFLLAPCQAYWADIKRRTLSIEEAKNSHPLLASCGRPGREFQEMLVDRDLFAGEFPSFTSNAGLSEADPTLLQRLQDDLLRGGVTLSAPRLPDDSSLRIVSCHTRLREIEILHDHILALLDAHDDLELRDMVVMAPDIQRYAPFIKTVFDDLPYGIADRSGRAANRHIQLFQQFFTLCSGRCGWAEVLEFLSADEIAPQFGLTGGDFEQLKRWVLKSGIRWGLSEQSRQRFGVSFKENSWTAGLERLLMSYAVSGDEEIAGILPLDSVEGNAAFAIGGLCDAITFLERSSQEFCRECSLAEWGEVLQEKAVVLFGDSDDADFLSLLTYLRGLAQTGEMHTGDVAFAVIVDWFTSSLDEFRAPGGFLDGQLTFCSMLPMRAIPFRVVALLGLNNGEFPKNEIPLPFDLLKAVHCPGDRSVRDDDRYQFLEALLSARDSLYISYQGRDQKTNEQLPPSVVVSELLDLLGLMYGDPDAAGKFRIVEEHPLYPFSPRYFKEGGDLFSYDAENCALAVRFGEDAEGPEPWWKGALEKRSETIAVADLVAFFSDPQKYFVNRVLGMRYGQTREEPEATELFSTSGLNSFLLGDALLQQAEFDASDRGLLQRLRLDGEWPLGGVGELLYKKELTGLSAFFTDLDALALGDPLEPKKIECTVDIPEGEYTGSYLLTGILSDFYSSGWLFCRYGKFRFGNALTAWLYHLLAEEAGLPSGCIVHTKDRTLHYEATPNDNRPGLPGLLSLFLDGNRRPPVLIPSVALAYCEAAENTKKDSHQEAVAAYNKEMKRTYSQYLQLLYGSLPVEDVLGREFTTLCDEFCLPIWSRICR